MCKGSQHEGGKSKTNAKMKHHQNFVEILTKRALAFAVSDHVDEAAAVLGLLA